MLTTKNKLSETVKLEGKSADRTHLHCILNVLCKMQMSKHFLHKYLIKRNSSHLRAHAEA